MPYAGLGFAGEMAWRIPGDQGDRSLVNAAQRTFVA